MEAKRPQTVINYVEIFKKYSNKLSNVLGNSVREVLLSTSGSLYEKSVIDFNTKNAINRAGGVEGAIFLMNQVLMKLEGAGSDYARVMLDILKQQEVLKDILKEIEQEIQDRTARLQEETDTLPHPHKSSTMQSSSAEATATAVNRKSDGSNSDVRRCITWPEIKVAHQEEDQTDGDPQGKPFGSYNITSQPKGMCVIINNEKFNNPKQNRSGSVEDVKKLEALFGEEFLGFHVSSFSNLTASDIQAVLKEVSKWEGHRSLSCLVVCIMSHGGKNGNVKGIDGSPVQVESLMRLFVETEALAGKPKIFIVQACRGGGEDKGIKAIIDEKDIQNEGEDNQEVDEKDDEGSLILPSDSDFLVAYATTPGYLSFRRPSTGSWFIKALDEAIRQGAEGRDLLEIMTEVNRKVAEEYRSYPGQLKQMPQMVTTLRYKLFLPPVSQGES